VLAAVGATVVAELAAVAAAAGAPLEGETLALTARRRTGVARASVVREAAGAATLAGALAEKAALCLLLVRVAVVVLVLLIAETLVGVEDLIHLETHTCTAFFVRLIY